MQNDDSNLLGFILFDLGRAYFSLSLFEMAKETLEKCLGMKRSEGDTYGIASVLDELAKVYAELGDKIKSRNLLSESKGILDYRGYKGTQIYDDVERRLENIKHELRNEKHMKLIRDANGTNDVLTSDEPVREISKPTIRNANSNLLQILDRNIPLEFDILGMSFFIDERYLSKLLRTYWTSNR